MVAAGEECVDEVIDEKYRRGRGPKYTIRFNLSVLCATFLGVFTSYQATCTLQSSGVTSDGSHVNFTIPQLVTYATLILSSIFLPEFVITRIGMKTTLVLCQIPYCLYISAFYYPHLGVTIPASVLLGLSAAPLWTAKCRYLCYLSERYTLLFKTNLSHTYSILFGLFFTVFLTTGVWGKLIYYLAYIASARALPLIDQSKCGLNFNYDHTADASTEGFISWSIGTRLNLISIYLSIALVSILLLAIYIDGIDRAEYPIPTSESLLRVSRSLNLRQVLLIPLTVWSGVEQSFFAAIFSEAFIVCSYGYGKYGLMLIIYSATASIASLLSGIARVWVPQKLILSLAATLNLAVLVPLLVWNSPSYSAIFSSVVLWGVAQGIWQPQIGALYAELNPGEQIASFSHYRLWESVGYTLIFALKVAGVAVGTVIYITLPLLIAGLLCYFIFAFVAWKHQQRVLDDCGLGLHSSTQQDKIHQ